MTTSILPRNSTKSHRSSQARIFQIAGLGILLLLAVVSLAHTVSIRTQLTASVAKLSTLQSRQRIANHFSARYSLISSTADQPVNPRVLWTDLLQTELAGFSDSQLVFSIADPAPVPIVFSGRSSNATVNEYLLQLSAKVEDDARLIELLQQIHGIGVDFIRNRSCHIKRTELNESLSLDCIYSILDLVTKGRTH